VTIAFKIKDPGDEVNGTVENINHTLMGFEYAVGEGSWTAPVNGDASGSLGGGWPDNSGSNYGAAGDFTGAPAYSFTWNTLREDFGSQFAGQWDVRIRFKVRDSVIQGEDTYLFDSVCYATSESFVVDNSDDADGDGLPDHWEFVYGVDDPEADEESDGLTNLDEYLNGTNPTNPDTDGDGISDGWEVGHGYNPLAADAAKIWDNNSADGYWSNPNNWSDDILPTTGDLVVFNAGCVDDCYGDDIEDNVQHLLLDYGYTGTVTIGQDSISGGDTLTVTGDVTVSDGSLVCKADPAAIGSGTAENPHGEGITINAANITVGASGHISADGQGFLENDGPGAGESWSQNNAGAGGGHGGYGGDGYNCTGGAPYGLEWEPTSLGSGGAAYTAGGGNGGGAMKLEATDTITVHGTISANGDEWYQPCAGGGAGGSIWMVADTLEGAGTISTQGGNGCSTDGGGGSGGRIHIDAATSTYTGTKSVSGGTGFDTGDEGSLREE
jgi:hypothetical protein